MKMEMCLLMNQADIYGKGPLCISFPEGKGMLMKKIHDFDFKENTSERPVDALVVKTSLPHLLTI